MEWKGLAGGLIVGLMVAAWQYNVAADLRTQNRASERKLKDKSSNELAKAKQACSDRSQRYFTSLGYTEGKIEDNAFSSFEEDYNEHLRRCLMTITGTSFKNSQMTITRTLFDADEKKTFGDYGWVSENGSIPETSAPIGCSETPPDEKETRCQSTADYDAYEKKMMSK